MYVSKMQKLGLTALSVGAVGVFATSVIVSTNQDSNDGPQFVDATPTTSVFLSPENSSPSPSESSSPTPSTIPTLAVVPTPPKANPVLPQPTKKPIPKPTKTTKKPAPAPTKKPPSSNVHPGAFCSPTGATGLYKGKLYTCKGPGQSRWRR